MHFGKLPSHVKIGHIPVSIRLCKEVGGGEAWGEYSMRDHMINLHWDLPWPGKALEVLLHEISHAIWHIAGINSLGGEKDIVEERFIASFATWWAMVYRDNPELVKWIAATAKK